jgi:hypothetical protein
MVMLGVPCTEEVGWRCSAWSEDARDSILWRTSAYGSFFELSSDDVVPTGGAGIMSSSLSVCNGSGLLRGSQMLPLGEEGADEAAVVVVLAASQSVSVHAFLCSMEGVLPIVEGGTIADDSKGWGSFCCLALGAAVYALLAAWACCLPDIYTYLPTYSIVVKIFGTLFTFWAYTSASRRACKAHSRPNATDQEP